MFYKGTRLVKFRFIILLILSKTAKNSLLKGGFCTLKRLYSKKAAI
ncbi:hypothetical protein PAGA_b0128 [Pseudoalteromonas agarivorans DSM 14585]|uniref:Uncharacterized protein n=1 Tax=Pseudoalteromonas agarivorans DSM 14585 TaxID=1312369 RepID=A0ACA8E195_9GAMM|nr:hypothetical protein PAGA_b0128 [Pseudoalteromonas agarivorans DSM 14585]